MRGSRLSLWGSLVGTVVFILFIPSTSALYARMRPLGFPIPGRMTSLGRAVTPGQYAQLRQAIKPNWERDKARILQSGPALGSDFTDITAARIRLGALGRAMVVYFGNSPRCGATGNCPMAVYVRVSDGYQRVISAGGWGYALLSSGSRVPDMAFYWNMSAGESNAQLFHHTRGKFVPTRTAACNAKDTSVICTAMNRAVRSLGQRISPAEYDALRPAVEANREKQSPVPARQYSFDDAHAMGVLRMQEVTATAVGLGQCGFNRNCRISIYARHYRNPEGRYFPLLRNVTGWGVTEGTFEGSAPTHIALVIARRLSANEDELTRYVVPLMPVSGPGNLSRNSRLLPEACEIVAPKTGHWPAWWNRAALVGRPVSCFKTASPGNSPIPMADTTSISTIVRTTSGTVWALGSGFFSRLYRWRSGGWNPVPTPALIESSSPEAERRPNMNERVPRPIGL